MRYNNWLFLLRTLYTLFQTLLHFLSDSASVFYGLGKQKTNCKLIAECHEAPNEISLNNQITFQWIKWHSGSPRNDKADELAKRFETFFFSQNRTWIRQRSTDLQNKQWTQTTNCRQSRIALPGINKWLTKRLLNISKDHLGIRKKKCNYIKRIRLIILIDIVCFKI